MPTFRTGSEEETISLGVKLAPELPRGVPVLLIGNLGAGKTTLAKGIVKGLGAGEPEEVSSPTFTLIHEYSAADSKAAGERTRVYHIDLYRLDHACEAARIGLEELFESEAVILIEWGEKFPEILPEQRVEIRITPREGDQREITVDRIHI